MTSSPYFDNICTLPLLSDLFCQALHPTEPILTVGLASGHVHAYRLPSTSEQEEQNADLSPQPRRPGTSELVPGISSILTQKRRSSTASENGLGSIDTIWKTRRHKGSCRVLGFSPDGRTCFSGGTDGLVKAFHSSTGRVISKIALPQPRSRPNAKTAEIDAPTVLHVLTPLHLVVGTDSGALHIYDLKISKDNETISISQQPVVTHYPHGDEHVNKLIPIPASDASTSGHPKQFITVGGSTLAVTDLRKGILSTSEDQEEELTSITFLSGLKRGGTSVGQKILVGQGDGVLSLWERGAWDDLDERVIVDRTPGGGASIDAICEVPAGFLPRGKLITNEKVVAVGLDDGRIRFVRVGRNMVLEEWDVKHDEVEGVVAVEFDGVGERMISGGGQVVKVWTRAAASISASANVVEEGEEVVNGLGKRGHESDSEDQDQDNEVEEDSDEEQIQMEDVSDESGEERGGKRKKRKRNKGKNKSGGRALNLSGVF